MLVLIVCLIIFFMLSIIYIIILKKDIKSISSQIKYINDNETNAILTTISFDKQIKILNGHINELIEIQKKEILEYKRLEKLLKQAITNVAHDLRTPITTALGYLQIMNSDNLDINKLKNYSLIIEERLKSLSDKLEQLFEFANIIEREKISFEKISINEILSECLAEKYIEFINSGFEIDVITSKNIHYTVADKQAVQRIFENLINNALIHGCNYLSIIHEELTGDIIFTNEVKDVSVIDVTKIFERFYTADYSRTKNTTGLGLAIVKTLVNQNNAKVNVKIEDNRVIFRISFKKY